MTSPLMPASLGVQGRGEVPILSGRTGLDLLQRDLVVSADQGVRTQLTEILDKVVGEGVVVIDD